MINLLGIFTGNWKKTGTVASEAPAPVPPVPTVPAAPDFAPDCA